MIYRYDLNSMQTFVDQLGTHVTELTNIRQDAQATATAILKDYEGDAAEEFDKTHSAWQKDMVSRIEQLDTLRKHVETCKHNYEKADAAIKTLCQGLTS